MADLESPLPDFESMTIEEIEAWRIPLREEMREIKARIDASKDSLTTKIRMRDLGAQLRIDTEGLSPADLEALQRVAALGPKRAGDVSAEPGSIDVGPHGHEGETQNE